MREVAEMLDERFCLFCGSVESNDKSTQSIPTHITTIVQLRRETNDKKDGNKERGGREIRQTAEYQDNM